MAGSKKAVISLLIAVLLFGAFSVLAFTGLFDLLEARFYNPSVTARLNRDIAYIAEAIDKFFTETRERFSETLKADAVRRGFSSYQEDASARSKLYSRLTESFYGVQWVRFIDADGQSLLFSSYGPDVLDGDEAFPIYKDYDEPGLPYGLIAVPEDGAPKYTFDGSFGRVVFSFPLYDSFDIYWGTALFSLSIDALSARLVGEGRINHDEDITVISDPAGLLIGMPASGGDPALVPGGRSGPDGPQRKVLVSTGSSHGFSVGRLVSEEVFLLPTIMKIILLAAFFLTTYLIIFLLFNLRQDPLNVIQNRLRQLQISLLEQFYERKGEADWARWIRELEQRREEIRAILKRGVKVDSGKDAEMDILINRSWDELLVMMGSRRNPTVPVETVTDKEKNAGLLKKASEKAAAFSGPIAAAIGEAENIESADEMEILEELEEAEDLEIAFVTADAASVGLPDDGEKPFSETEAPLYASQTEIDKLASQIEFSPDNEAEATEDGLFNGELEIVSPFSAMVFDSSPADDSVGSEVAVADDDADGLYADAGVAEGLPLITTPFFSVSNRAEVETLEASDDEEETPVVGDVIREREGVNYISEDALSPSPEFSATLNREFKELVDEVKGIRE